MIRIVLLLVALATPAFANDAVETARQASTMLSSARDKLEQARSSRTQIKALADGVRAYEVALVAMQSGLRDLRGATRTAQGRYEAKRDRMQAALVALQAMEEASTARRVWHPGGAKASVRAGMVLSDLVPVLNAEAESLQAELSGLATLTALQEAAEADIREARTDLSTARDDIERAMVVKAAKTMPKQDRIDRLETLARNATSLADLASGLLTTPVSRGNLTPQAPGIGSLEWPVTANILRDFNQPDAAGIERPGIILQAPAQSLVLAPAPAEVSYAGPFLDHGRVVILEIAPEHLLVLAGMGRSFVSTGDMIETGTPIGLLAGENTSDEEFLINLSNGNSAFDIESLYIEFRIDGIATNPVSWFKPAG